MNRKIPLILFAFSLFCVSAYSQQRPIIDSIHVVNAASCSNCNGRATATVTGGVAPYTYYWSNGERKNPDTLLCPGTYYLILLDSKGDSTTRSFIVGPPPVTAAVTFTNATCSNNNGSAMVTASGGASPYTYSWTPSGGTNALATGLSAGTYTIKVTDKNGCTATKGVTITSGLSLTYTATPVSCHGGNNGAAAILTVSGGVSPYTYSWSPSGGTNAAATGLSAGAYNVKVTDKNGCTSTANINIIQPAALADSIYTTGASCSNNNGSAYAVVHGGTGPYTYSWSPSGGTGAVATGLSQGTYTVTIKDNNGCGLTASAVIAHTGPTFNAYAINDSCYGKNDGAGVIANVSGGVAPYTYSWSSGSSTNVASGLSAGTYTFVIVDKNFCTGTGTVIVRQPTPIVLVIDTLAPDTGSCSGIVAVVVHGGNPPYAFSWSAAVKSKLYYDSLGYLQRDTNLCHGAYQVCITDRNGCKVCDSVHVRNAKKVKAGIEELYSSTYSVNLYPDPVRSQLTVQVSGISTTCKLEVYDMIGRQVLQQNDVSVGPGKSILLDVSKLTPGKYMLRLSGTNINELRPFLTIH